MGYEYAYPPANLPTIFPTGIERNIIDTNRKVSNLDQSIGLIPRSSITYSRTTGAIIELEKLVTAFTMNRTNADLGTSFQTLKLSTIDRG